MTCTCGKQIKVPDTMAGKKGKCPGCGSVIEIAAAAPAPKKDDLLLELDDPKPKARPIEALIPPVQELPDAKGPKKKAGPRISSGDLLGDDNPHAAKKRATAPPSTGEGATGAGGSEGKIACPQCGEMYTSDTFFCMKCKIDLSTGKAFTGLVGKQSKTNRPGDEYDPEMPFWKITLGMLYKPASMMQYFAGWFERKDVQVQMIGFYVLSFLAIAIAAGAKSGKVRSMEQKGPTPEEQIAKIENDAGTYTPHIFEGWTKSGTDGLEANDKNPFVFRINSPVGPVEATDTFTVKFAFCEPGPGKGILGDAYVVATENWKGKRQEYAEWVKARSLAQPGDYEADLDAEMANGSSYEIIVYEKGVDPFESGVKARSTVHVAWASKPGWAKQVYADLGETDAKKKSTIEEEAAKLEKKKGTLIAPTDWKRAYDSRTGRTGQIGEFYWKVENPPQDVEAGKKFLVTIEMVLEGEDKKPGAPIDAEVYVATYGGWADDDEEGGAENPKANQTSPGKYSCEVTGVYDRATLVNFMFCPKGQKLTYNNQQGELLVSFPTRPGWAKTVVEKERKEYEKEHEKDKPTTVAGKATKALMGGAAIFGAVLANILGLAITAGVCTLTARLFGGGGSFLLLLCTLAYVTGFTNMLELIVFFVPAKEVDWVAWVVGVITALAHLLALMKVFDLDLMTALLASFLARAIVLFGVGWLILAIMGTSMMIG
ncbi:MAG: Yip1 family protein [Planctomycetota bacterium]